MYFPRFAQIRNDRSAFALVAILAVVWFILYSNLQPIADWVTYSLLGLSKESQIGEALNFFIYDVPKLLLLSGMIFLITLLQTFINTEKVRALVEARRGCWQPDGSDFWRAYAVLLLLICAAFHRFCAGGHSVGYYLFIPDHLTNYE